ncbi:MAG: hypothetical protein SWK90_11165 [Chloroflexota bacterium]|nr:hypothetical protein [Chloroflexota bacterium]
MTRREFTPTTEYRYNRTSPGRWILSHVLRYPLPPLGVVLAGILANTLASWSRVLPGRAFDCVLGMLGLVVPIVALGTLQAELLLVPLVYIVLFVVTLRRYIRELNPVSAALREQFGTMNAGLAETISGIEVVKANAQEIQEQYNCALCSSSA